MTPLIFTTLLLGCIAILAWMFSAKTNTEDEEPRVTLPPENLHDLLHEIACTTDHAKLTHLAARAMRLPAPAQDQCFALIQIQLNQP